MKKLIYSLLLVVAAMFTSCHEVTTEDTSFITYYVTFDLDGGSTYLHPVGSEFVDPGFTAMEGSEDVTANVSVDYSAVDGYTMGLYTLIYSAVNADGFSASTTRTVIVYDENYAGPDLAGSYTIQPGSYRDYSGTPTSFSGFSVNITTVAPGFFYVSDLIGGYYDQGVGYGSSYAMTGYITLEDDNETISLISSYLSGWGDSLDYMESGKYDAAAGTLYWEAAYASVMTFYLTLGL